MFQIPVAKYAEKLKRLGRALTPDGREIPDPTPLAPPLGYEPRQSMFDRMREMIRSEQLALMAERDGKETFAEANDFGDDDDGPDLPRTPYEDMGESDISQVTTFAQRSKAEQDRVRKAEDRIARKIARAVKNPDFEEETPVSPKPPRKSASEPRRGSSAEEAPEPGED